MRFLGGDVSVLHGRHVALVYFPSGRDVIFGPFTSQSVAEKWLAVFMSEVRPWWP